METMTLAAAAAVAVLLLWGQPARSDDDCDTVMDSLKEELEIATKKLDTSMEGLKKSMTPDADDKKKASVKNAFCSVSGEYLGTTRAFRAVSAGQALFSRIGFGTMRSRPSVAELESRGRRWPLERRR